MDPNPFTSKGLLENIRDLLTLAYNLLTNNTTPVKQETNVITVTDESTQILAANSNRVSLELQNEGIANVFLGFGENPTTDDYSKNIPPASLLKNGDGGEYVDDNPHYVWKGAVYGICISGLQSDIVIMEKIWKF